MATLTNNEIVDAGLTDALVAAAAGGDQVLIDSDYRNWIEVANASGGSINVTLAAQQTSVKVSGQGTLTIASRVIAVAAGARRKIPLREYMKDTTGYAQITYSAVTSVTVGAFRSPAV